MALKTTSGCGPLRSTPEQATRRTEAEDAAADRQITIVVGEDFVRHREEVKRGIGEGFVAGLRIAPEGLRCGEKTARGWLEARVEYKLSFAAIGRRWAVLPEPLHVFLSVAFCFSESAAKMFAAEGGPGVGICADVPTDKAQCCQKEREGGELEGAARHGSAFSDSVLVG